MIRMWCIHDNIYIVYDGPIKCDGCPMPTAFEKKGRRGRKGRMRPRPRPRTSQRPRPRPRPRSVLPLPLQNPSADSKLRIHSEQFKSTRENPCQNSGTQSVGSTCIFYGGKYQKIFSYLPSFAPKDPKARHLAQTPSPPCRRCGGTSRSWAHRRRSGAARQNACRHPRRCVRRTSAAARGDRREQRAADPGDGGGGRRPKGHDMYGREGFAFAICGGKKNLSNSQPRSGHDTYFFSSIWMAWYHPMPRLGAPQPTRTTSA